MNPSRLRFFFLCGPCCAGLLLAACTPVAPPPQAGPATGGAGRSSLAFLAILASPDTPDASRQAADARLLQNLPKTDPARLAILEQLLYAPGHSDAMRIYAIDQLAAADPARCANALLLYLPRMEGDVLQHACNTAIALGDPRLLDALTRSLARAAKPLERPELPALQALSGKPPIDALLNILATSRNTSTQTAALTSLEALLPAAQLLPRIAALSADENAFLGSIQWWVGAFGTLPAGDNECRWVGILHRPEHAALIERALSRHKLLAGAADYVAAPRFIAALAYSDDAAVALSRDQLLADLHARIDALPGASRPHNHRPPPYPGSADDLPDTLAANEAKLTRGDLLTLRLLLDTLPAALPTLYQQGLDDLADTTTEHGGLLSLADIRSPQLAATLYPPAFAENDLTYPASEALLRDTPLGLAQYHFHFQQIHNEARAGPGPDDLASIRAARCNALLITSINTRQINLDFYTSDGALVDLGTCTLK